MRFWTAVAVPTFTALLVAVPAEARHDSTPCSEEPTISVTAPSDAGGDLVKIHMTKCPGEDRVLAPTGVRVGSIDGETILFKQVLSGSVTGSSGTLDLEIHLPIVAPEVCVTVNGEDHCVTPQRAG